MIVIDRFKKSYKYPTKIISATSSTIIVRQTGGGGNRKMIRIRLRRLIVLLLIIFALTALMIIQSITSYQRFQEDKNNVHVVPQTFQQNQGENYDTPNRALSHEEAQKLPYGDGVYGAYRRIDPKKLKNLNTDQTANLNLHWAEKRNISSKFTRKRQNLKDYRILELYKIFSNYSNLLFDYCHDKTTLETFWLKRYKAKLPHADVWDEFYSKISTCDLYDKNSQIVDNLLRTMAVAPIRHIANLDSGTQIKFIITFENGKKALFKPMRFSRNFETHPDQFYFTDFERHNAEIAAFHLDRLLGFRRAVPTVGRIVNITSEFLANAEKTLARTFFYSPAKNLCFVGKCDYYCDTTHAVCGKPDLVEGSFQAFLPNDDQVPRDHVKSPYKRTYSKRNQQALWQKDSNYCNWKVKYTPPYSNGRALLDLVDLYIFDFLVGNQDRHHYEIFTIFDNPVYFLHLDNGRAFGKTKEDDVDILAPLAQCCIIRPSTLKILLDFYVGRYGLGESLKRSLSFDPVNPVLADGHFRALDRRLEIILHTVNWCLEKRLNRNPQLLLANYFHNPEAPLEASDNEEDDDG